MLRGILLHNGIVERFQCCVGGCLGQPPSGCPHPPPPLHTTMFPCIALVMPFSRDTLTELNMTLVRLSGAKSLRDPLVSQLLGEWVASSPLARVRWSDAMEVGYPSLIRTKQVEAVKQYASHLFPAPDLIGLLMDLNVPKLGFRHVSEYMSRRGSAYSAATGLPFPRPIPTRGTFTDTWKELVTPLDLRCVRPRSPREWALLAATLMGPVRSITPIDSGDHRLGKAPHLHCAWGCVPVRRW